MRICLMIEGQEDVSWDQWREIAAACESTGIEGLFRSDHYLSVEGRRERGSLDAWGTICALAAVTKRLRLGTLVSPVTFRHPSVLAKLVATADQISKKQHQPHPSQSGLRPSAPGQKHLGRSRIELGLGAGWYEPEHRAYGFEMPDTRTRIGMLSEQLELVHREWTEAGLSFSGEHYRVEDLDALPRPERRPRIIVGGSAGPRSAALAARWADEYNTVGPTADQVRERRAAVASACERIGRDPGEMAFSLMTGFLIGADRDELRDRASRLAAWRGEDAGDPEAFIAGLPEAWIVGTVPEAIEQLRELERAGAERVMLQHNLHTDHEAVALIGRELVPAVAGG
jgi:alkanesulfonate monooxygenase SsuD/methylene tetrahydromethanopterin reductase-like flavin-dependent oxidoreductase (luciferase family)